MINVLHIRDTSVVCGPGKTILESAKHIDSSRFSLSIAIFKAVNTPKSLFQLEAENRKIPVVSIESKQGWNPSFLRSGEKAVLAGNFDIIHSHDYKSDILAAYLGRKLRIPIVTTLHGWITNTPKQRFYVWIGKQTLRSFDAVLAVSAPINEEAIRCGVPKEKCYLVHNAIVCEDFVRDQNTATELRRSLNLDAATIIVSCIGRLSLEKGQRDLLHAASLAAERGLDAHFVFVGDGPDKQFLMQLVSDLGLESQVSFLGHLRDVRPVLAETDLLVIPSHTEGLPNVALESLAMSVPTIATNVGGTPEIIKQGITGFLIPPHSPEAIFDRINELTKSVQTADDFRKNGLQHVKNNFAFSTRMRKVEKIYDAVLSRPRDK